MTQYPCVLQDDASTCGIACLATVAHRFGDHPSWLRLREAAGHLIDGTNLLGLSSAAKQMGFLTRAVAAAPEALPSLPTPFVAHVTRLGQGHFVVVHKVRRKHVIVADPAEGLRKLTTAQFLEMWSGKALLLTQEHALPPAMKAPRLHSRLLGLILPHWRLLTESMIASLLTSGLAYASAILFSSLVDTVYPSGEIWTLHFFGMLAAGVAGISAFLGVVNGLLLVALGQRVSVHLTFPTLQRLFRLPMTYFETRRLGDILSRFGNLLGLKSLVTRGPVTMVLDGMILLFTSSILFLFNWQMALAVLGVLPVMLLGTLLTRVPVRRLSAEALKALGKLDAHVISTLGAVETVKAYGAEDLMAERSEPSVGQMIRLNARMEMLETISRVINRLMAALALILIYWLGGSRVMTGELTLGQLIFCITLAGSIFPPFLSLLELILQVQEAMATLERATDIVDAEPEVQLPATRAPETSGRGEIRMEGVRFRYGHEQDILHDISFTVPPGEVLAIVGPSGSGKSTMLKLLERFYSPQGGRILMDGLDLRDWHLDRLRSNMALVDQECRTFAGSILDNLRLAGMDIPMERFHEAIRLVQLAPLIEGLTGRYETDVGEAGIRLSGGERQRLALARAIARRPRILLLDEATSHLDPGMEREIFMALRELLAGTTIIMATHRIALARMATRALVLEGGRILEQGTPGELLSSGGLFAQFSGRPRETPQQQG